VAQARNSGPLDETVDHLLLAGLLEGDGELVAVDPKDSTLSRAPPTICIDLCAQHPAIPPEIGAASSILVGGRPAWIFSRGYGLLSQPKCDS
jgi:hypothetical protein